MIIVLRLGHRKERDKRISTHVGLVARAFGADEIIYCGEEDPALLESVRKVAAQWGGKFKADYAKDGFKKLRALKKKGFKAAHLTMYGVPFEKKIGEVRKASQKLVVIVGAEKVPGEFYRESDWNLGVGNQPHSEVAALAVVLYELNPAIVGKEFKGWTKRVAPKEKGKMLLSRNNA